MDAYDYIIVGAGSAGCVLAERLSRDGRFSVALLEAGGTDRRPWIKLPLGYAYTFFDAAVNWKFTTEPCPGLNGRTSYWPRGKVLGGSSSINALVYVRGLPHDFDDWAAAGATGWGWDDVKPHFERIERLVAPDGTARGDGPLTVTDVSDRAHPVNRHFLDAAAEVGFAAGIDLNGPTGDGIGIYPNTIRNGLRCSAADAFLRPAMRRRNLSVLTHCLVCRVDVVGRRAQGVSVVQGATRRTLVARREVILSAGAIGSPHILQLSGIGPGDMIAAQGLPVLLDNPNVGRHLQDHLAVDYYHRATEPTLNTQLASTLGKLIAGLRYILRRRGPLSHSVNQCGGFVRSSPGLNRADMQLYFNPLTFTRLPKGRRSTVSPDPFPGCVVAFQPSRPESRGRVDLASPDPTAPPRIRPNYLSADKDIEDVVAGGNLIRRLLATAGLRRLLAQPVGPDVRTMTDAEIVADFRARSGSVYHPVSTCRIGRDAASSVVGPDLRVHGLEALRVADASVFPNITSGNTNAPSIMVGDKAGDLVLADAA